MSVVHKKITRFYWLDVLRGVAALVIVFWHWNHFVFDNQVHADSAQLYDITLFPLYNVFRIFYGQGWRAVQLFFTLSGFIFFWLYRYKISQRSIGFVDYMKKRFSRIYPLHVLTLLLVIILQYLYYSNHGFNFIYHDYSLIAFLGSLTLTYQWFVPFSPENVVFNGPSWSISVEMGLYILFFLSCYFKLYKWYFTLAIVIISFFSRGTQIEFLAQGIMSFYMGGIAFYVFQFLANKTTSKIQTLFIYSSIGLLMVSVFIFRYLMHAQLPFYFFEFAGFPLAVIVTALLENKLGSGLGKKLSIVGDISFSCYLIHFPLQLAFILVTEKLKLPNTVYYSPLVLGLFFTILILLSILSFKFFEKPVQNLLRQKW
jgi:peptidoglycan/LPS O-acetylase OafA/YrhL